MLMLSDIFIGDGFAGISISIYHERTDEVKSKKVGSKE